MNAVACFSIIFNLTGDRSRKTKLQTLSREFLKERIQEGRRGHCSIEDSAACMKLVKLKLQKSLYYGDAVMGGIEEHFNRQKCKEPKTGTRNFAMSLLKHVTKFDKTACVVAVDDISSKYQHFTFKKQENEASSPKIHIQTESSNKAVVEKTIENAGKYSLNIAHIRAEKDSLKTFSNIDKRAKKLFESMPTPGLCMVVFGGQKEANGLCFVQVKDAM